MICSGPCASAERHDYAPAAGEFGCAGLRSEKWRRSGGAGVAQMPFNDIG